MQRCRWIQGSAATALALIVVGVRPASAEEIWSAREGTTTLSIYNEFLAELGLSVSPELERASPSAPFSQVFFEADGRTDLTFTVQDGSVVGVFGGWVQMTEGLTLMSGADEWTVPGLAFAADTLVTRDDADADENAHCGVGCLQLGGVKVGFDAGRRQLTIFARDLTISPMLASTLGATDLEGVSVGAAHIVLEAEWIGGDEPLETQKWADEGTPEGGIGPDVTMCQVYGLIQYGRVGDIVGLASAGTSWNVGDAQLDWFPSPNPRHPFIVFNLYRIKNDRFEQIGQSWVKHGFCALDNSQCTTQCAFPTGCATLNVGCTDTYSSSLNAGQSGLGPRHEVNPWTGDWSYAGSHFSMGGHSHNGIQHRLQVHDADLDPAQNPGATYYFDQYYVCNDDVNVMNSAGWKPCTPMGEPGGSWIFSATGPSVMPNIGFAFDAWQGARQTLLAQEIPVVEFESPDGRCMLLAKATDMGAGTWHYEYAVYNIDMDRKGGSFSVPIPPGTSVTNAECHTVDSHDEPYSNDEWTVNVAADAVTWTTTNNPLRWGTSYNFRFDADAPPGDVTATLGLYEPGTPTAVTGVTTGPLRTGPEIVHGSDGVSFGDWAFGGFVDSGRESNDGQNVNMGMTQLTVHFSEPVRNIGGAALSAAAFSARETGAGPAPNVTGIATADNQAVTITLDRIITLKEWTTIVAAVENFDGVPIANLGDLGPDATEPDRIDVGYLPCDVNQDAAITPFDLLSFRQIANGVFHHENGVDTDYLDIDRDGGVSPFDLLTFRQLINGVSPPATQAWNGQTINNAQP